VATAHCGTVFAVGRKGRETPRHALINPEPVLASRKEAGHSTENVSEGKTHLPATPGFFVTNGYGARTTRSRPATGRSRARYGLSEQAMGQNNQPGAKGHDEAEHHGGRTHVFSSSCQVVMLVPDAVDHRFDGGVQ